jgi:hypothetical protein
LKPPRGGLVGCLHLGNDTGERAIAQAVLGERQYIGVLQPLCIEEPVGAKTHLFQAWGVQIEATERPEHRSPSLACKACGDASGKQGSGGIVTPTRTVSGNFVEACAIKAAISQPIIEF